MPLILALKNRDCVVAASDVASIPDGTLKFGQFMNVPGRAILLVAGNLEAVRRPVMEKVVPALTATTSPAELAQLIQAALVLDLVPHLGQMTGRVEIIVAGIDPVRHTDEPGIYYLDSAQDFYLKPVIESSALAGSTAAAKEVLAGSDLSSSSAGELVELAKECLASTKLRWPATVGAHQTFAIVEPGRTRILNF